MQIEFFNFFNISVILICVCSTGYLVFALFAVELFNHKRKKSIPSNDFQPPVTILKPIYGLDPELIKNLRSFCQQDYPNYQIIFGLHSSNDLALPIVKKMIKEFKHIDVSYVVDSRLYGANHKVSNLMNMYPTAKHDYLLIADSDMRVPNNYLSNAMSPFADSTVGAVTCLYSGSARGKLASSLNAMFINEWFLPSVLISRILQPIKYCLGATMVVRRDLLDKIGGFRTLSNYLADDYMLGKLISDLGYKIHLSDFVVENIVEEASMKDLLTHELRWARTLRRVEPLGYALTFLTDTLIISSLTALVVYIASHNFMLSSLPVLLVLMARCLLHLRTKQITGSKSAGSIWLIPLRDLLSFSIRVISFTGTSIQWRNNSFNVDQAGLIHAEEELLLELDTSDEIPDLATSQDY
jgi:ceramide glucosyltransferase